jgi:hypothetical protein
LEVLGLDERRIAAVLELKAYVTPILNFIPRSIPQFTDHGVLHSNNLLRLLVRFRKSMSTTLPTFSFQSDEIFLLSLAAYLHDIGCIIERPNHNIRSAELIGTHKSFSYLCDKLGKDMFNCLSLIIKAHSSNFELWKISKEPLHRTVRLRLMCAVFRLLDACEISAARISKVLYDILTSSGKMLPKEAKYWEAHYSICDLFFKDKEIVIDCDDLAKAGLVIDHLKLDLNEINRVFSEENFPVFSLRVVNYMY